MSDIVLIINRVNCGFAKSSIEDTPINNKMIKDINNELNDRIELKKSDPFENAIAEWINSTVKPKGATNGTYSISTGNNSTCFQILSGGGRRRTKRAKRTKRSKRTRRAKRRA